MLLVRNSTYLPSLVRHFSLPRVGVDPCTAMPYPGDDGVPVTGLLDGEGSREQGVADEDAVLLVCSS